MKPFFYTLAITALATPAFATEIRTEFGLSTLGVYVAPTFEIYDNLNLRAPLYFGSRDMSFTEDGTTLDGKITTNSGGLMLDYYPARNSFRISAGLLAGGYDFKANTASVEFDGVTYTGYFDLRVKQDKEVVPALAIGYARPVGKSGWSILTELGAKFAKIEATSSGQEALAAADLANYERDLQEFNDKLGNNDVIPFATLSVGFTF